MMAPITKFLGYAGLIPFIALSALVQFASSPLDFWSANSLLIYSASIASFIGALHWGALLGRQSHKDSHQFWRNTGAWIWGVIPSLLAWIALHLAFSSGYFLIAMTLLVALIVDRRQFHHLIEDEMYLADFLKMRTILTLVATVSLILAGISIQDY